MDVLVAVKEIDVLASVALHVPVERTAVTEGRSSVGERGYIVVNPHCANSFLGFRRIWSSNLD
jgi:hypothetical protein